MQQLSDAQVNQLKGGDNLFALEEEQNQRDQVDILNKKIGKLFSNANGMVKRLCDPNVGSQEDLKVRKNIQMGLAGDLQSLSSKFRPVLHPRASAPEGTLIDKFRGASPRTVAQILTRLCSFFSCL